MGLPTGSYIGDFPSRSRRRPPRPPASYQRCLAHRRCPTQPRRSLAPSSARGARPRRGGHTTFRGRGTGPCDAHLDAIRARDTLDRLGPHHRAALTPRYVDDLPVAEVAALLDRTVHATEALLVRA